jgi:hypothetical protein
MLSGLCTSGATGVWHALDNLQTFTAYLNEDCLNAVSIQGYTVSICNEQDPVLRRVILQVCLPHAVLHLCTVPTQLQ